MVPTDDKVRLVDALSETGLRAIEITSFVNPKWIPQLADGAEVSRRITRKPGVVYSALVPNKQGLDAAVPPALAAGLRVRAYVSTVYGCPYEGAVDPAKALELCRALKALGCYQVSLGDTIG